MESKQEVVKVVLVGDNGVGKTRSAGEISAISILRSGLTQEEF